LIPWLPTKILKTIYHEFIFHKHKAPGVLATVFSLVILLFGAIGMTYLGVREFPSVDPPIISVDTSYPGANSDVIETQITEPLEQSINGIPGIRTLTSRSSQGRSSITVEFELTVDMEAAANDVRDKVSQAQRFCPVTAIRPPFRKPMQMPIPFDDCCKKSQGLCWNCRRLLNLLSKNSCRPFQGSAR
jgi:hypothetical protein